MIVLDKIMVDILRREPDLDALDAHRLELEHHQRAEHILEQRLVDRERDLHARLWATLWASLYEMRPNELVREGLGLRPTTNGGSRSSGDRQPHLLFEVCDIQYRRE